MLKFNKGDVYMRKNKINNMRTPEEKEKIVKEYLSGKIGFRNICSKYDIAISVLWHWIKKYEKNGINGLKSNTGISKGGNKGIGKRKPKNRIEELELELMKKEIEIARLKKGYMVKGVGAKKEFVTIFDKNTK